MQAHEFYEVLPDGRYKFRVDHHTINDSNTCDRYFQFRHMPADANGNVWGTKTLNMKIAIGSWWSSVMESYYHELSHGVLPHSEYILKFASEAWKEHEIEKYKSDPTWSDYYDKFGGLDGGRLMALEYHTAFGQSHLMNWHIVGTELGFGWKDEVLLGETDEVVVYYGGKPDLIIIDKSQNMIMPLDFKTKDAVPGNADALYKPHPQTAGYIYAVRHLLKQLEAIQQVDGNRIVPDVNPPTKCMLMVCARIRPTDKPRDGVIKPRFRPVYPQYNESDLEEWRLSVIEKCARLRRSIEHNYFPPRESACHLYYHGCAFRRVCSTSANMRQMVLNADFVKVEPWKPYLPEED